ncbi:MAG: DUF4920 domain-containing protein [Bacteroidetes bacterium]|nr:DUF4920 domain-containing protein [Bacteroidota bacterium]
MRALLVILIGLAFVAGTDKYGKKISAKGAVSLQEMVNQLGDKETLNIKVTGTVKNVCKVKGCWMTMELPTGEDMRVTFKDYGFFVPKDCNGKTAIAQGTVTKTVTSVADLRHFAKDEGASDEEIEKITEPKEELTFVADGVILK